MANQIIILVADRGDPKHGEITVLEDADKAERLVETLLEAGFEQERIRIFTGADVPMRVSYRPVVEISAEPRRESDADDEPSDDRGPVDIPSAKAPIDQPAEPVSATAYTDTGVTFSSEFRPMAIRAPHIGLRRGDGEMVS